MRARFARWRPDGFTLLLVALAALGVAHVLVRTASYGAAIDADGINYLGTAENLLAGDGLITHRGQPLLLWPPFFPMLTAFIGLPGVELAEAGRLLNAAAFGLILLLAGLWFRSVLRSRLVVAGAVVAILVALPVNERAAYFMTETLFALLTLAALIQLGAFLEGRDDRLIPAALFAALAALTRYAGLALLIAGTLLPLLRWDTPLTGRMKRAVLFGAVSALPLALLLVRNRLVSDTWTGERGFAANQTVADSLTDIDAVVNAWLLLPDWPGGFPWAGVWIVVLAAAAVLTLARGRGTIALVACFVLADLGFHVAATPLGSGEGISGRYLLQAYPLLILLAAFLLDRLLMPRAEGAAGMARWGIIALAALVFLTHAGISVQRNLAITARALERGYPEDSFDAKVFNTKRWKESAAIRFLRERGAGDTLILSNATGAIHLHGISGSGGLDAAPEGPRLRQMIANAADGAWVAWFREQYASAGTTLRIAPELAPVAEFRDASIYRVDRASAGGTLASWRAALDSARASEPLARSAFALHPADRALAYVRDPCSADDTAEGFFLHVTPADADDLPRGRGEHGFDNLDFPFERYGVRFDGACLAIVPLPDYAIERIRTGQWSRRGGESWSAAFPFPTEAR